MSRYQRLFDTLNARGEGAFVPFVTLGDPNPGDSLAIIEALIAGGADALELGFPFSDPAADGPTIQEANIRALNAGTTPNHCFEMLATIRARHPDLPIGLLVYANLVFSPGLDTFYRRCAEVGVDSVLVADVPVQEAGPFIAAAKAAGVAPIFIAPPNADEATLKAVAEAGEGYTYLLSRAGVTGTETAAGMPVDHLLDSLKRHNAPPAVLGFGIAEPEQVKTAIVAGAAGAISGSAVVKRIAEHHHHLPTLVAELTEFVQKMKAATR
ncbi:tryptophan synthase subunit alpha [Ferrimonas balearica]|uniref:tryptophan synthase subunit alpha n=1 Tax=Ferrimonas balearica TaxID=44012 RepID=UPI001C9A2820|nr:tryptophan synthase subunit alpha [Ferrimonas balearica]MBY5922197.1 tryptophan synthase subunit alpha [Ferrimonas balearica]MBY5994463.1 tryptophan synthase subunit alpha [Ferrimonas balearica]